jgi:hypothetical protein
MTNSILKILKRSKPLAVALTAGLLVACAGQHGSGMGDSLSSASYAAVNVESLNAFQNTVYSYGKTQGCVKCHGNTVSPAWDSSNITAAYYLARPLLDVNNPTGSVFASYAGNGHCADPVCSDPAQTAIMQDLLSQWAAVEINQGSSITGATSGSTLANPAFVTASLPIPAPLPLVTERATAVMRFNLAQMNPPVAALTGAMLEISIQSYNLAGTEYKVFNPRLVGASSTVKISGIHVYIRPATGTGLGTEDIYQGDLWSGLSVMVSPLALPSPLPSGPMTSVTPMTSTSLGIQVQSTADVMTIGFAAIE